MGDGSGLFPLVRRDGRHRRLAHLRGIARRAPHAGDRRIRRLSVQREDPGPVCSGSWAWIRKRTHRCWSWMRPGSGVVSMAWLIPWFAWMPRRSTAVSPVEQSSAGFLEILKQRSMWGTCGGLFGANYVLYFEITWLPFYLVRERHLPMGTMAKIGGLGYLCYSVAAVLFGWISDRWIASGGTPTLVRKTFAGVG